MKELQNPAAAYITANEETAPAAQSEPQIITRITNAPAPAIKNTRTARYNLLLNPDTKKALAKKVKKYGYKSVNDYINYLIEKDLYEEN